MPAAEQGEQESLSGGRGGTRVYKYLNVVASATPNAKDEHKEANHIVGGAACERPCGRQQREQGVHKLGAHKRELGLQVVACRCW